jgi:hypothetical protein
LRQREIERKDPTQVVQVAISDDALLKDSMSAAGEESKELRGVFNELLKADADENTKAQLDDIDEKSPSSSPSSRPSLTGALTTAAASMVSATTNEGFVLSTMHAMQSSAKSFLSAVTGSEITEIVEAASESYPVSSGAQSHTIRIKGPMTPQLPQAGMQLPSLLPDTHNAIGLSWVLLVTLQI